jgi:electron-transferring-flavoprotein dehydrogenase
MERESMEFDLVIVGGGPSGLSAAIRFKQLANEAGEDLSVVVLEKGGEIGAHILSGVVMDPVGLDKLIPDWRTRDDRPLKTEVTADKFLFLGPEGVADMSLLPMPGFMKNHGNFTGSLANVTRWLGQEAENLGVEVFPGFAASEVVYGEDGRVKGVVSGVMGIAADGSHKGDYQPGMELLGKYVLFAEGARGSLTKELIAKFNLDEGRDPQKFGIGLKELWSVPEEKFQEGYVQHTMGWPLDNSTGGGSFLYHFRDNGEPFISVGFVVHLNYANPYISPYQEFQRFKHHPAVLPHLEGGKRVAYGARAITEGGFQSVPKLAFPGGALIGCGAGFVNVPRIKGSHNAMKTGMLAAEAVAEALKSGAAPKDGLPAYTEAVKKSWVWKELYRARNMRPQFHWGMWAGLILGAIDTFLFFGHAPWTLKNKADHSQLKKAKNAKPIDYPKPDGKLTFDKLSSVQLAGTFHEEEQPCHLTLKDASVPMAVNWAEYAGPEQRFCPAGVYEYVEVDGETQFQINGQNCIHCKTCDIKDPNQNINWTVPEGGGGPAYPNM